MTRPLSPLPASSDRHPSKQPRIEKSIGLKRPLFEPSAESIDGLVNARTVYDMGQLLRVNIRNTGKFTSIKKLEHEFLLKSNILEADSTEAFRAASTFVISRLVERGVLVNARGVIRELPIGINAPLRVAEGVAAKILYHATMKEFAVAANERKEEIDKHADMVTALLNQPTPLDDIGLV